MGAYPAYKKDYDAMVFIDGTDVVAIDGDGSVISRGVAGTDDATVIQAAITYINGLCATPSDGKSLCIGSGTYSMASGITISYPHRIYGNGPSQTILKCTAAITLIDINPTDVGWQYVRFTLENLTLDGSRIGLYGITHNGLTGNSKVLKSQYMNLVVRSFMEFGVVSNSNWGCTYTNVFFKFNGEASVPPAPIAVDSGGILIRNNCNYFYGCAFDWNTCGLVFTTGYGSCLYGCVIEGNKYHGIYAYSNPAAGDYPQHITIDGAQFELNGVHNNTYPGSIENLYDIYIADSTAAYFSIKNCKTSGDYVTESVYSLGTQTTVLNYRCMHTPGIVATASYDLIDNLADSSSIGDYTTTLSYHNQRIPASVIVYKIGSTCYAKDGSTGKILISSTTDQDVLTYLRDTAPGSTIYFKRGIYEVSSGIYFTSYGVNVYGEQNLGGIYGTVFKATQDQGSVLRPSSFSKICNIVIDCNSKQCSDGGAIFIGDNGGRLTIDNCVISGCGASTACIYIYGETHTNGIIISNNRLINENFTGVLVGGSKTGRIDIHNNVFNVSKIGTTYGSSIRTGVAQYLNIRDNYMYGSSSYGIYALENSSDNIIVGNRILNVITNSIFIGGSSNIIESNTVTSPISTGISKPIVKYNLGYIDISEIRDPLDITLEKLGTPRLLCPSAEVTGTSITDYTRLSNTLTAQASVADWYGFQGRATYYDFDGAAHYLYRSNDTDFDFGDAATDDAFSVVCCVNPDDVTSRQIIGKWDDNNQREWRLFFDANGYPTMQLYDESADTYIGRQDQTAFTTGSWQVLVATYDGSGINAGCKIYIDGVQLDDADYDNGVYVAMEAVTANLMVGALKNAAAYSEYYDGKMTWIGVAAKELSADEVWSLTQRLKGVLGI